MKKQRLSDIEKGGLVLGWSKNGKTAYYTDDDTHSVVIGATRSGKSRHVVLPSIGLMALAGESIIAVDPKAELYLYTNPFLKRLGYEVITIDFRNQNLGSRYNFLQPVLDAVDLDDIPLAVARARDIAQMLVPENNNINTDPLWPAGQRTMVTVAILAVCLEHEDPAHRNLANAYDFLGQMCRAVGPRGETALPLYLEGLPQDSPLRRAMAVAQIAPNKMRGSFDASALMSMTLFTDPAIHDMTSATDFDHMATGDRKRAIFLIVPDERSTYYPLVSLFVYEQYQALIQRADELGGRLPRRVNFVCDEFGNFTKINDMDKCITVGGGRGIRFHLFVQDTGQVYDKYGKEIGKTILYNCETWVYLATKNGDTLKELEEMLGKYTTKSPNLSGSTGGHSSAGYSFTGRSLLMPDEIRMIDRPYQLVIPKGRPCIMYAPDLSKTVFNGLYGLGDKAHNLKVMQYRQRARSPRSLSTSFWLGWKPYVAAAMQGIKTI